MNKKILLIFTSIVQKWSNFVKKIFFHLREYEANCTNDMGTAV